MLWFSEKSSKKRSDAVLRARVMPAHGRIVDRVLQITGEDVWGVADNFVFRFDVMVFFVSAVLRHLHHAGQRQGTPIFLQFSQTLWDVTFEGFEESLRDRGVTDIRMAARMRKLLQNAMGRRNAYLEAWEKPEDQNAIRSVIARNVFNGADATDPRTDMLLAHLQGFVGAVLPSDLHPSGGSGVTGSVWGYPL